MDLVSETPFQVNLVKILNHQGNCLDHHHLEILKALEVGRIQIQVVLDLGQKTQFQDQLPNHRFHGFMSRLTNIGQKRKRKKKNAQRRKRGLPELTVIVKDGKQYFAPRDQVRKKYYHFPKVFKSKLASELSGAVLDKLVDPTITTYENRRRVLDSPSLLPEASVVEAANDMRKALINSDTVVKQGTFGGNMKKRGKIGEVINGSIFYNKKRIKPHFSALMALKPLYPHFHLSGMTF